MSMQTWTTSAYGVREDDIGKLDIDAAWPAFLKLRKEEDADFEEDLQIYCEDQGEDKNGDPCTKQTLSAEQKEEFIQYYYRDKYALYSGACPQAMLLADILSKLAHIPLDDVVIDSNEDGQTIVGIPMYAPWETPESLKNATQNDYDNMITEAFAFFGVASDGLDIDMQSIENWG